MKNKKIAIIIQHLAKGGAEASAARLSKGFFKAGFDPVIIVFNNIADYDFAGRLVSLDAGSGNSNIVRKIFSFFKRLNTVKKIKAKEKFAASISLMENANFINILSRKGEKVIISVRNDIPHRLKELPFYKRFLVKTLYRLADKCVLISKKMRKDAIKLLRVPEPKAALLYNPIETKQIKKIARENPGEYGPIFDSPVVINSGRLQPHKGQWHLIRIFRELKKSCSGLKLVILGYGDGFLKNYLTDLSIKCGLKTYTEWGNMPLNNGYDVYFLGFVRNPYRLIARSKLFLFPSVSEGLGNSLIEALACGTPVISSDCLTGPADILAPERDTDERAVKPVYKKYGVLMPPFDGKLKNSAAPLSRREQMWIETAGKFLENPLPPPVVSESCVKKAKEFDTEKIMPGWRKIANE